MFVFFVVFFTICREYLATFKKTVAMHEVFLQRLAAHPVLRMDMNFEVFLQFDQEVNHCVVLQNKIICLMLHTQDQNMSRRNIERSFLFFLYRSTKTGFFSL